MTTIATVTLTTAGQTFTLGENTQLALTSATTATSEADRAEAAADGIVALVTSDAVTKEAAPLFHEAGENVLFYTRNEKLSGNGLDPLNMVPAAAADLAAAGYREAGHITRTSGRAFYRLRTGLGLLDAASSAYGSVTASPVKIAALTDSWGDRWCIFQYLADRFVQAGYALGATGWISLGSQSTNYNTPGQLHLLHGTTMTAFTNFTLGDVTSDLGSFGGALAHKYGPDGYRATCTTTTGNITVTDIRGTTLRIYYVKGNGTFTYAINGGSATSVVGDSSGAVAYIEVTGLTTGFSLTIATTGNAGTVDLLGFYATGLAGVEISKMGNGGATAPQFQSLMADADIAGILGDVAPDAAVLLFGTNDKSQNVLPSKFKAALTSIKNAVQTESTGCGVGMIVPPPNGADTGNFQFEDLRNVVVSMHVESGLEYYSMADDWPLFADNTAAWELGFDDRHLSFAGAAWCAREIFALLRGAV